MPRYFIARRPAKALWVEDEAATANWSAPVPTAPEHVATDTGLLDLNGSPIMRAPNPIGFGDWNGR